ncbi:MAG: MFS transporter [Verrucomicrobiota bacterium]|nr:MFS transporter [Verrucomicrobiota bacterium]
MKEKNQKNKVITISLGHMFHDIYASFLAPMLPLLIAKYGMTLSMAAFLDFVRKVPSLFNPLIGLAADKVCLRYLLIVAPAITAISMSLLGLAPSYIFLLILLFVAGISSSLFHVPGPVMIRRYSQARVGAGMSYYMLGGEMARTLGPLLITGALSLWGLEGSFRVMPLGIIASLVLFFKLKNVSSIAPGIEANKKKEGVKSTLKGLRHFLVFLFGFQLARAGMKASLTLYLPIYLTGLGKSLWVAGISLSILQFAGAFGVFVAGHLSDRISRKTTLLVIAIANPILMWLFVFWGDILMIPLLILLGFFLFASGPVILALVQEVGSERPAFMNSISMTINFSISTLMVLFVGYCGDVLGLEYTFKICAVVSCFSLPFLLFIPKEKKK